MVARLENDGGSSGNNIMAVQGAMSPAAQTSSSSSSSALSYHQQAAMEDPYALSMQLAQHLAPLFEDVVVAPQISPVDGSAAGGNVNEVYLLHGTTRNSAEVIARDGFDERLSHANGNLFGDGSYFTNALCKSHKYSTPDADAIPRELLCSASAPKERCVLISRVLLGSPCVTTDKMPKLRRPPTNAEALDVDGQATAFDSVIGNGKLHKEFVVYDKAQALPYCLVRYTTTDVL